MHFRYANGNFLLLCVAEKNCEPEKKNCGRKFNRGYEKLITGNYLRRVTCPLYSWAACFSSHALTRYTYVSIMHSAPPPNIFPFHPSSLSAVWKISIPQRSKMDISSFTIR